MWWNKFYSRYRKAVKCTVGEHRYQVSNDHLQEVCVDCTHTTPHIHEPLWTGIKAYKGPARMGRFAFAPHQWMFEGTCKTCGEPVEKWDALPLISMKLFHLRDCNLSKKQMDALVKEFNET